VAIIIGASIPLEFDNSVSTKWVSDITYIATLQGWLYLTVILDLADRKVIGWALSDSLKAVDTSVAAWRMALINRPIGTQLIFHSDRAGRPVPHPICLH
jgi:transposase InsO family protein